MVHPSHGAGGGAVEGLSAGSRIQLPGESGWVTVQMAQGDPPGPLMMAVADDAGLIRMVSLTAEEAGGIRLLEHDLGAESQRVLAGMWTQWMAAANHNARTTILASTTLKPYIHQASAIANRARSYACMTAGATR